MKRTLLLVVIVGLVVCLWQAQAGETKRAREKAEYNAVAAAYKEPSPDRPIDDDRLVVEKAVWGAPAMENAYTGQITSPEISVDVTERIQALVDKDSLCIPVHEKVIGCNPAPMRACKLTVLYRFDGELIRYSAMRGRVFKAGIASYDDKTPAEREAIEARQEREDAAGDQRIAQAKARKKASENAQYEARRIAEQKNSRKGK